MIVGSAFSGVGGFDLACHRMGMGMAFQIELHAFRASILKRHFPEVDLYDDVLKCGSSGRPFRLPQVDLLTGGFPCRDLSGAGLRRGIDGVGTEDGSKLFFELARLADELVRRGGWILVENVPGMLSSAGGRDFAVVLRTLGDLGFHDLAWRVLDSRYFGVPQRRRRVFVLARRADGRRARDVLLEPEVRRGDSAARGGARESASLSPREGLEANISVLGGEVAHTLRGEGFDASEDGTGRGIPLIYTSHTRDGGLSMEQEPTNGARALRAPQGGAQHPILSDGERIRRLTPTEEERLQGFPDGWTIPVGPSLADAPSWYQLEDVPRYANDPPPHGPRYEACGRAVTVPVIEWIAGRLLSYGG